MLLPLVGIALFAMYFLFLRRRRKDEEDDAELAMP
jgi:LPXTG-motif cell wall-anchored protein